MGAVTHVVSTAGRRYILHRSGVPVGSTGYSPSRFLTCFARRTAVNQQSIEELMVDELDPPEESLSNWWPVACHGSVDVGPAHENDGQEGFCDVDTAVSDG